MARAKLLIVDDDRELGQRLGRYLIKFDYDVIAAVVPEAGLSLLKKGLFDLVILDVMLPEMDGFEFLRELRKNSAIPVIMLTARGDVSDRIVGLELGADDYLPKPFEPRELVARIQTVLKRQSQPQIISENILKFGSLIIDLRSQSASIANNDILLTHLEFELLKILAVQAFHVLSRDQLLDKLRGLEWETFDRSIDVLMSRLRNKLKDNPRNPVYIKTVRGSGYMFIAKDELTHD